MKKISLLLFLVFAGVIGFSQNLKPWKINMAKGQKLKVESKTEMNLVQKAMGQEITVTMDITSNDSADVTESTPGKGFKLSKTTTRIQLNMSAMGQEKSFDSDKKEDMDGEMGGQMKDKVHVTSEAEVSEKGGVKIAGEQKESSGMDAMASMMPSGNDSGFISSLFMTSPAKELKPGEQWKDSTISEQNKVYNTYTYMKQENGIASVDFMAEGTSEGTTTRQGMELKVNMKSLTKGVLHVDVSNGLILERKITLTLSGTNEMMGMEIPVTGDSKTLVIVKKY
jgi:hypothetical protein